jgi:hypothetical protein
VREEGICFMGGSRSRGRTVMRTSVTNAFTDEEDVEAISPFLKRSHQTT